MIEQTLSFLPENKEKKDIIRKTCQRTFQALRIDVNHEFEVLYEFMEKLPGTLKPGGRVAILTFHSGEDKLVKDVYKRQVYSDAFCYLPDRFPEIMSAQAAEAYVLCGQYLCLLSTSACA